MLTLDRWLAEKPILREEGLREEKRDLDGAYYACPCGGKDHFARRNYIEHESSRYLSPVLNCYETTQQWAVKPVDVRAVILKEEKLFIALLDRAVKLVPKVIKKMGFSDDTIRFLRETHGVPEDLAREIAVGGLYLNSSAHPHSGDINDGSNC